MVRVFIENSNNEVYFFIFFCGSDFSNIMNIQKKHYDAYNYWFNLTEKGYKTVEAMELTAEEFGVTLRCIQNWASEMEWQKEAMDRRKDIQKKVEKKANQTLANNRKKYLDIIHRVLYDYVRNDLKDARIESMKDLEIAIKTGLLLQDAPTDVVKQDNTNLNYEVDASDLFDKNKMREILEKEEASNTAYNNDELVLPDDTDDGDTD